ncbi:putative leucine-rich repeat-containing protein DDB_G0290503 isoform X2 [Macrobrachium rosenbergii]|uniref:putative leucine-rich repeat-containing protein DDB_G0290503 isoform X2 n=1 Tax=Macrobrachium rosenbergii TaxID=79674 RepID=UPI0034D5D75F
MGGCHQVILVASLLLAASIQGSCNKFIYCKDLSDEGIEDWYVLLFTCPEGQVFEESSSKCIDLSSVKWRPECHSDGGDHVSEEDLIHNRFLDMEDLATEDTLTTYDSTSEKKHPGTLKDSSKQDDKNCDGGASVACGVPGKDELNKNGTEISANVHQEIGLLSMGISRQNNESVRDDTSDFSGQDDVQERKKRSANSLENKANIVDNIALKAVKVCNDMKNINKYVAHVRSTKPLESTYKDDFLMDILNTYNQNLKSTKENTKFWDMKKGIIEAITEVFTLTREFGPKLKTQFRNMKTSIATLPKTDQDFESNEINMNKLKEEIESLKAQTKSIEGTPAMKTIIKYLQQVLEQKKLELDYLIQNGGKNEMEFQQLTELLEFVLNSATEIQEKSSNAVRLMKSFHQIINQDCDKFRVSISKAQEGKRTTEMTKKETQKEIDKHKTRIKSAEREIKQKQNQIKADEEELQKTKISVLKEIQELDLDAETFHKMVVAGGVLMIVPFVGWITGAVLLGVGIEGKKEALRKKAETMTRLEDLIKHHNHAVATFRNTIRLEELTINTLGSTIRTSETRLLTLQEVNRILHSMESSANSIIPFITDAASVLAALKDVFSSVEGDLFQMKHDVNEAHIKAKKGIGSYFRNELVQEKVEGPWQDAKSKITSLGDCLQRN